MLRSEFLKTSERRYLVCTAIFVLYNYMEDKEIKVWLVTVKIWGLDQSGAILEFHMKRENYSLADGHGYSIMPNAHCTWIYLDL